MVYPDCMYVCSIDHVYSSCEYYCFDQVVSFACSLLCVNVLYDFSSCNFRICSTFCNLRLLNSVSITFA